MTGALKSLDNLDVGWLPASVNDGFSCAIKPEDGKKAFTWNRGKLCCESGIARAGQILSRHKRSATTLVATYP